MAKMQAFKDRAFKTQTAIKSQCNRIDAQAARLDEIFKEQVIYFSIL